MQLVCIKIQRQVLVSAAIATSLGFAGCSVLFAPADGTEDAGRSDSGGRDEDGGPNAPDATSASTLRGDELIARYYFDEDQGKVETLADSSGGPDTNDLEVATAAGFSIGGPANHRGMQWEGVDSAGKAFTTLGDSGLSTLAGKTQITFEFTLHALDVGITTSSLLHLETGAAGPASVDYSLQLEKVDNTMFTVLLVFAGQQHLSWPGVVQANTPVVLHLVLDTEAPLSPDRAILYADGSALTPTIKGGEIAQNAVLNVVDKSTLTVGNAGPNASRSIQGRIGYTAVYSSRLSEGDIDHNAAILSRSDDRP